MYSAICYNDNESTSLIYVKVANYQSQDLKKEKKFNMNSKRIRSL